MDTNNYNYYEEEEEISLINLIGYVFRHLKKMLIVSIVVALVLGGLLGYKKSRITQDDNFDTNLASNEILEKKLDSIVKDYDDYIEDSSFFNLSANNSYQAKALYLVDTGYQVIPSSNYQNHDYTLTAINAYIYKITSNGVLNGIAKKYNICESSINDYISVSTHDYMIDINVYYLNKDIALNILHELEEKLLSYKDDVSSNIVDNNLTKVSETVYEGANNNILLIQKNKLTLINDYIDSIKSVQSQLSNLQNQADKNVSFTKKFIKFGVILFLGTFTVLCVYFALAFIFGDKVYSTNEFKNKTKLRVLGNLTYGKNGKYIEWINRIEKRPAFNDFDLIASNIKAYSNNSKILLSGNIEKNIKEDIVYNLNNKLKNVEIISCGSLLNDPKAIELLNNVDSVILLVKCNESTYKNIKQEIEKLFDLKVTNVYALVVE